MEHKDVFLRVFTLIGIVLGIIVVYPLLVGFSIFPISIDLGFTKISPAMIIVITILVIMITSTLIGKVIDILILKIWGEEVYGGIAAIVSFIITILGGIIGGLIGYGVGLYILDNIIIKAIFSIIGFVVGFIYTLSSFD